MNAKIQIRWYPIRYGIVILLICAVVLILVLFLVVRTWLDRQDTRGIIGILGIVAAIILIGIGGLFIAPIKVGVSSNGIHIQSFRMLNRCYCWADIRNLRQEKTLFNLGRLTFLMKNGKRRIMNGVPRSFCDESMKQFQELH